MQAAAAGVEPEAAMNPVLLKPGGEDASQVVVLGRPVAEVTALSYRPMKAALLEQVLGCLADLRSRFDVVVCEGAGSPTEINLRADDIANMGLATAAGLPVVVVGDIDRGGVFPALYGTVALMPPGDQRLVAGFLVNKFRGDVRLLAPGLEQLAALTGRPTLGVLPWLPGAAVDVEDSLGVPTGVSAAGPPAVGRLLRGKQVPGRRRAAPPRGGAAPRAPGPPDARRPALPAGGGGGRRGPPRRPHGRLRRRPAAGRGGAAGRRRPAAA